MEKLKAKISFQVIKIFLLLTFVLLVHPQKEYAENPAPILKPLTASVVSVNDTRVKTLQKFLQQYNSPLSDYAYVFVEEADKNNIDWRLLPAISGVESTFGQQIPEGSYNAWGFGIYGDQTRYFESWEDAIVTISQSIRSDYINKWGAQDVYDIGRYYAASPTWAVRVDNFMQKIEQFGDNNPTASLSLSI